MLRSALRCPVLSSFRSSFRSSSLLQPSGNDLIDINNIGSRTTSCDGRAGHAERGTRHTVCYTVCHCASKRAPVILKGFLFLSFFAFGCLLCFLRRGAHRAARSKRLPKTRTCLCLQLIRVCLLSVISKTSGNQPVGYGRIVSDSRDTGF